VQWKAIISPPPQFHSLVIYKLDRQEKRNREREVQGTKTESKEHGIIEVRRKEVNSCHEMLLSP